MTTQKHQSQGGHIWLNKAGLIALFVASWLGLAGLLIRILNHLRPAWASGDPASLAAGLLLAPMALYLIQGVWYLPRRPAERATFIRPRLFKSPIVFLLWPTAGDLETGPTLAAVSPPEEQAILLAEARARLAGFTLIPRLSLLLEGRSPIDLLLDVRADKRLALLARPARLLYLVMGPARQFLRVWGYVFFRAWAAWDDPGPVDALTDQRRRTAFDLGYRAAALFSAEKTDLAQILAALRRVYNQDGYGREFSPVSALRPGEPEAAAGPAAALYAAPYLASRYCGVYLDLPVTLAARTVDDLYDQGGEDSPAVFYPPELGEEVAQAALLTAERRRLRELLDSRQVEGLMWLDGRPVLTWRLETVIADLEEQIAYWEKRVAGHHRRCRSSHLAAAGRWGNGWPEALRGLAGLVHFAEHSHRALSLAVEDLARTRDLATADGLFTMIRNLGDRLTRLDLPPELEVRGETTALAANMAAPAESSFGWWLETWPPVAQGLSGILEALKDKALTDLLAAEDTLDRLGTEGAAAPPAPPKTPEPEPGYSLPPHLPAAPERVYSPAERLKAGFGRTSLALLILALLCWQGQSLGLSRLTAYNGLGRDVTVTVDGRSVALTPFSHALWRLQPGRAYEVLTTTADGQPIETFTQTLTPFPGAEIYNVAGAAPLMEWRSPSRELGSEAVDGRFLGRPRWLTTRATVFFQNPEGEGELVLTGYGDLSPAEMLAAFTDYQDRLTLTYLHARWDSPLTPWFRAWQALLPEEAAAAMLLQRVEAEPDFLDLCVRWFEGPSDPQ